MKIAKILISVILVFLNPSQLMTMNQKTHKVLLAQTQPQKSPISKLCDCEICFDNVQPHEAFSCSSEFQHAYHHQCLMDWLSTGKRDFSCIKCHKHNIDLSIKDEDLEKIPIETIGLLFRNKVLTQKQFDHLYQSKSVCSWQPNIEHADAWFFFQCIMRQSCEPSFFTAPLTSLTGIVLISTMLMCLEKIVMADKEYTAEDLRNFNIVGPRILDLRKNFVAASYAYVWYICLWMCLNFNQSL